MRLVSLGLVLPFLFDVSPAGAIKKLGEKKVCSFTVEIKCEGDAGISRYFDVEIAGQVQKPDVMIARNGNLQVARRASESTWTIDGKEWKDKEAIDKERREANQRDGYDPLASLEATERPAEEIGRAIKRAAGVAKQKGTEKFNKIDCSVFEGGFTREGAAAFAKDLVAGVTVPTRGGPNMPGGGTRSPLTPKDARGGVRLLIGTTDELPYQMLAFVVFECQVPKGDELVKAEITIKRTVTWAEFDTAKVEIPAEAKKKLGIADR